MSQLIVTGLTPALNRRRFRDPVAYYPAKSWPVHNAVRQLEELYGGVGDMP
jgi:hypothetical protein